MNPKFPDVEVQLTEVNGNALSIMGAVSRALQKCGHGEYVPEFRHEAMSGDYDHLLQTCMRWVDVT